MPHAVAPLPSDASIMQGVPPMLSRPVVLRVARPRCSVGSVMAMRRGALSSSPPGTSGSLAAFGRPGGKVRRRIEPRPARPPPPSQTNAPVCPTCPLSLPPTEPSGARTEVLESCAASRRAARGCRARLGRHAPRRCNRHVPRLPPSPSPRLRPRRRLSCRRPLPQQSPLAPGPPSFLSLPPLPSPSPRHNHRHLRRHTCYRRQRAAMHTTALCRPPARLLFPPFPLPPTPVPVPLPRRWRTATATMALAQLRWPRHLWKWQRKVAVAAASTAGSPAVRRRRQ